MKYTSVSDPKWVNAEHTALDALVTFEGIGTVWFTANIVDPYQHAKDIFRDCAAGVYGPVAEYVPPPPPEEPAP